MEIKKVFNDKMVLVDNLGNQFGPFDEIIDKIDKFLVKKQGEMGLFDKTGKVIIPCEYDEITDRTFDFLVKKQEKTGVIDETGKVIVPCAYDEIKTHFVNKRKIFIVRSSNLYGCFDAESGKELLACEYTDIDLEQGILKTYELEGRVDLTNWNIILPVNYQEIVYFDKKYKVKYHDKYGILDITGKEIIPCVYDRIEKSSTEKYYYVSLNNKMGVISNTGKEIVPCLYAEITIFDDERNLIEVYEYNKEISKNISRLEFYNNAKYGKYDLTGKVILPCVFTKDEIDDILRDNYGANEKFIKIISTINNLESLSQIGNYITSYYKSFIEQIASKEKKDKYDESEVNEYLKSVTEKIKIIVERNNIVKSILKKQKEEQQKLEEEQKIKEQQKFEEQKRIKHEIKNAMYKLDEISSELNSALINEEGKNV